MILIYDEYVVEVDGLGAPYYRKPDFLPKLMLSQPHVFAYKQFTGENIISKIANEDMKRQAILALEDFSSNDS